MRQNRISLKLKGGTLMQDHAEIPLCCGDEENVETSVQVLHNSTIPARSESVIWGKLKDLNLGACLVTVEQSSEIFHRRITDWTYTAKSEFRSKDTYEGNELIRPRKAPHGWHYCKMWQHRTRAISWRLGHQQRWEYPDRTFGKKIFYKT